DVAHTDPPTMSKHPRELPGRSRFVGKRAECALADHGVDRSVCKREALGVGVFEPHLLREPTPRRLLGRSFDVSLAQVKSGDAATKSLCQIQRTVPWAGRRVHDMTVMGERHEGTETLRQPKTARMKRIAEQPGGEVALVQARAAPLDLGSVLARISSLAER